MRLGSGHKHGGEEVKLRGLLHLELSEASAMPPAPESGPVVSPAQGYLRLKNFSASTPTGHYQKPFWDCSSLDPARAGSTPLRIGCRQTSSHTIARRSPELRAGSCLFQHSSGPCPGSPPIMSPRPHTIPNLCPPETPSNGQLPQPPRVGRHPSAHNLTFLLTGRLANRRVVKCSTRNLFPRAAQEQPYPQLQTPAAYSWLLPF